MLSSTLALIKYQATRIEYHIDIFLLFSDSSVIFIGNLIQSESSGWKSTKLGVFVILKKGQGGWSQPEVKINTSFLITWKFIGNQ